MYQEHGRMGHRIENKVLVAKFLIKWKEQGVTGQGVPLGGRTVVRRWKDRQRKFEQLVRSKNRIKKTLKKSVAVIIHRDLLCLRAALCARACEPVRYKRVAVRCPPCAAAKANRAHTHIIVHWEGCSACRECHRHPSGWAGVCVRAAARRQTAAAAGGLGDPHVTGLRPKTLGPAGTLRLGHGRRAHV